MPAQWTADIIGQMHLFGVKAKELAEELDWHPKYLSRVLNSQNPPKDACDKIGSALQRLIQKKSALSA